MNHFGNEYHNQLLLKPILRTHSSNDDLDDDDGHGDDDSSGNC